MSSSGGTHGPSYGYPVENDSYNPEQYGMRKYAGRDGYAPSTYNNDPPAYDYDRTSRRRSSVGAADDYRRQSNTWGEPGGHDRSHNLDQRSRGHQRGREYDDYDDDYSSSSSYEGRHGRGRDRSRSKSGSKEKKDGKSRSLSRLGKSVTGLFGPDDHHDGEGNSAGKKWGATLAGGLAGAALGRTAKKDQWMPAALGAVVGAFAAREAEKTYYRRREVHDAREKGHLARHGE